MKMRTKTMLIIIFTLILALGVRISCNRFIFPRAITSSEVEGSPVWSWGANEYAQLGRGPESSFSVSAPYLPGPVAYEGDPIDLATGWNHSMILGEDGTVVAWGLNEYGQVGKGRNGEYIWSPVKLHALVDVVDIAAGSYHSVAITSDGTVLTWGRNSHGELGNGSKENSSTPTEVANLTNVKAVAAGDGFTVALVEDGTVWAWGDNNYGQLGDGTTEDSAIPVQLDGLTDVEAIACGRFRTVALKTDGTIWGCGQNIYGQLAAGKETNRSTPVQAQGIEDAQSIACGTHHTLAVKEDGTVWAWGYGYKGELGIDGFSDKSGIPRRIPTLENIETVAGGWDYSIAISKDGEMWAWGRNWYGQYGMLTKPRESDTPIKIEGVPRIKMLVCRTHHVIAIVEEP